MALPGIWGPDTSTIGSLNQLKRQNQARTGGLPKRNGAIGPWSMNKPGLKVNDNSQSLNINDVGYGGGGGQAPGGGGGGYGGGPTAADIQAQKEAAEVAELKETIAARRAKANQIFSALTGAVQSLAQEKRGALEKQFATEQTQATEDFTVKGDELQRVYAGRGLGDSSYRINAVDRASQEYQRAIEDLGGQREAGLTKVGREAALANARIRADREALDAARLEGDEADDIGSLRELRDKLDARIREAEVQKVQFGTDKGFRGRLNKIAPYTGVGKNLKAALSSLINSAAPQVVKDRLASAIINNYAPEDSDVWQDYYDKESAKTESDTAVA